MEDIVKKHENQINKLAWSFNKTTGIEFEEFKSVGIVSLCSVIGKYDENRGALSTLIHISARNAMTQFAQKELRHFPVPVEDIPSNTPLTEKRYEFLDIINTLGGEAKEIINIILNGPVDFLEIPINSSPFKVRLAIKKYMAFIGCSKKQIDSGIHEIKGILK